MPPLSACQYPRRRAGPATGSIAESSIRVDADLRRSARIYPRTNAGSVPPALVYDRQSNCSECCLEHARR